MCLVLSDDENIKIAETDLICYKVCNKYSGDYYTYYRNALIELGSTYESELDEPEFDMFNNVIKKGLHSFVSLADAKLFAIRRNSSNVCIKAVIPKGSKYYLGMFNGIYERVGSYCSDSIKYLEVV